MSKADTATKLRKELGRYLKAVRENSGLTQRQLAEKVGFDYYTYIAQFESGRGRIPAERYGAYARALGIPSRAFVHTLLKFYDPITYMHLFCDTRNEPELLPDRQAADNKTQLRHPESDEN